MTDDQASVLYVTKGLDIGGIERIVVDLAIGMTHRGIKAEVAVFNGTRDKMAGALVDAGVRVHTLGTSDLISAGALRQLNCLTRSGDFSVVHAHGPLPAVAARLVGGRTPVVSTAHTVWPALHPLTRMLWRSTWRRDGAVVTVSSAVAQSLPRRAAANARVIPHGVDLGAVERTLGAASTEPRVGVRALCVASHRDVKNYPHLLRSFAIARRSCPELSLVAVGDGPNLELHRQLVIELGIERSVVFEPATLRVLDVMAEADLLVVASDFEGQPIVVMEAMALGLAVVATAVGRVPELLSPSVGRIVPPRDSQALAAALVELGENDELRLELGRRARSVSNTWTLTHVIEAHMELYSTLSRRRAARNPFGRRVRKSGCR